MKTTLVAHGDDAFLELPDSLLARLGLAPGDWAEAVETADGGLLFTPVAGTSGGPTPNLDPPEHDIAQKQS